MKKVLNEEEKTTTTTTAEKNDETKRNKTKNKGGDTAAAAAVAVPGSPLPSAQEETHEIVMSRERHSILYPSIATAPTRSLVTVFVIQRVLNES